MGESALSGLKGIKRIEKGFKNFKEINRVTYDATMISIEEMVQALKQAGTFAGLAP